MSDEPSTPDPENSEYDYEVGYGRPPKASQFKPGQSGNPSGRRKRPKSVRDQLEDILKRKVEVTQNGRVKRIQLQELMLTTLVNKAAKGDLPALKTVLDLKESHEESDRDTVDFGLLATESQSIIESFLSQATGSTDDPGGEHHDIPTNIGDEHD